MKESNVRLSSSRIRRDPENRQLLKLFFFNSNIVVLSEFKHSLVDLNSKRTLACIY